MCRLALTRERHGLGFSARCSGRCLGRADRLMRLKGGFQKTLDQVVPSESVRNADIPCQHRPDRQDDERHRHRCRRIVGRAMTMAGVRSVAVSVVRVVSRGGGPALTMEGQEHEAEHVDRRQERGHRANRPEQRAAVVVLRPDKCLVEDFVL